MGVGGAGPSALSPNDNITKCGRTHARDGRGPTVTADHRATDFRLLADLVRHILPKVADKLATRPCLPSKELLVRHLNRPIHPTLHLEPDVVPYPYIMECLPPQPTTAPPRL